MELISKYIYLSSLFIKNERNDINFKINSYKQLTIIFSINSKTNLNLFQNILCHLTNNKVNLSLKIDDISYFDPKFIDFVMNNRYIKDISIIINTLEPLIMKKKGLKYKNLLLYKALLIKNNIRTDNFFIEVILDNENIENLNSYIDFSILIKSKIRLVYDYKNIDYSMSYICQALNDLAQYGEQKKYESFEFINIPYCYLPKYHNKIYYDNHSVEYYNDKNCTRCLKNNQCKGFDKCNEGSINVIPITSRNFFKNESKFLDKFRKSLAIGNYFIDREDKYPIDFSIVGNNNSLIKKKEILSIIENDKSDFNLYIHIPFCKSKCNFCSCKSILLKDKITKDGYLDVLLENIKYYANSLKDKNIKNIFFGGGTPTIFSIEDFKKIFYELEIAGFLKKEPHISIEVTESTIDYEKINYLKSKKIKTIYIGIQSSDVNILKKQNRLQNTERLKLLSKVIISKEINLSVDIIAGLNDDTLESFLNTIKYVLDIKPNSIQLCRFERFGNTKQIGKFKTVDEIEEFFNYGSQILKEFGYIQSGIYDEIFYIDIKKLSSYETDRILGKTSILGFGAYAESSIKNKIKFSNNDLDTYMDSFSSIQNLNVFNENSQQISEIIATLEYGVVEDKIVKILSEDLFNVMIKSEFLYVIDGIVYINSNDKFMIKIILNLFFEDTYFEDIYNQIIYNEKINKNENFFKFLGASLDNFDNTYPIDSLYENFKEIDLIDSWDSYLNKNKNINKLGLYIHVPFCISRCSFCSCETGLYNNEKFSLYFEGLLSSIDKYSKIFKNHKFETIYFGGGTPGIMTEKHINTLFSKLKLYFNFVEDLFISFESAPYVLNESKLKLLKNYGVTRLSLGIQSVNDEVLNKINRPQNMGQLLKIVEIIKKTEFKTLNFDFVAGLPNETYKSIDDAGKFISKTSPDTVHIYKYYIDRNDSTEIYDKSRLKDIQEKFIYFKKMILNIGYIEELGSDGIFKKNINVFGNVHDTNLIYYNSSVLALGPYSKGHIFGKLWYKFDVNSNVFGIKSSKFEEIINYVFNNLENGIDILFFDSFFGIEILKLFKKEVSFLIDKNLVKIEDGVIYSYFNSHIDFISYYKIFWPEEFINRYKLLYFNLSGNLNIEKIKNFSEISPIK